MGGKKSNINQNKKIFNGFFFNQQTQVKNTRVIILYTFLQVRHIIKHIFTQVPTTYYSIISPDMSSKIASYSPDKNIVQTANVLVALYRVFC